MPVSGPREFKQRLLHRIQVCVARLQYCIGNIDLEGGEVVVTRVEGFLKHLDHLVAVLGHLCQGRGLQCVDHEVVGDAGKLGAEREKGLLARLGLDLNL